MDDDAELHAMASILDALSGLDDPARRRVLMWANDKFALTAYGTSASLVEDPRSPAGESPSIDAVGIGMSDFAGLFDATNPETEAQRVLVSAYWIQTSGEEDGFTGYAVQEQLRDLGQSVSNVTRTLTRLQNQRPALVRQLQKRGKTKQARKVYRVTKAGIDAVTAMIHGQV